MGIFFHSWRGWWVIDELSINWLPAYADITPSILRPKGPQNCVQNRWNRMTYFNNQLFVLGIDSFV
jgi:hypothetical protein